MVPKYDHDARLSDGRSSDRFDARASRGSPLKIAVFFNIGKTEYRAVLPHKTHDSTFHVEKATVDALGDRAWIAISFSDQQRLTILKLAVFEALGVLDRNGPLVEVHLGEVTFK
jgi:hypothetical protein